MMEGAMAKKRTLIVGDIHGCLREFEALLDKAQFAVGEDRLILVGDLVNKGPDSLGVLRKARELSCEVVLGNHEWNALRAQENPSFPSKYTEALKAQLGKEYGLWLEWFEHLPPFIEEEDFMVVHAGLRPGLHPSQTGREILTRIRTWDGLGEDLHRPGDPPWFEFYRGEKLVVFGHWASLGLMVRSNAICLDSGCVYGRELSALVLPERSILQVKAERAYEAIKSD